MLVILGLLVGGILAGQSLIRASELRSINTDATRYQTALFAFRDRYVGWPGDITNATLIWGKDDANCTAHSGNNATPGTCNGNGDGRIGGAGTADWEIFRAWQQMANAGLIEGQFSGVAGGAGPRNRVTGTNIPALRIKPAGIGIEFSGVFSGSTGMYDGDYGHIMHIGIDNGATANTYPFLRPEEAWNIDMKMDDGKPAYGRMRSFNPDRVDNPNCATSVTASASEYKFTESGLACALMLVVKL